MKKSQRPLYITAKVGLSETLGNKNQTEEGRIEDQTEHYCERRLIHPRLPIVGAVFRLIICEQKREITHNLKGIKLNTFEKL